MKGKITRWLKIINFYILDFFAEILRGQNEFDFVSKKNQSYATRVSAL